ncbi:hypothetical protein G6F43_010812 [Rhizopus delemar]|nr:hypothetical protein G6F43_010812 [Rhizopus delemar]
MNEDEANDKLCELRSSASSQDEKMAVMIAMSLVGGFFSHASKKESESNLIIETLRPFLNNCIIAPTKDTKYEWMTYRLVPTVGADTVMIPDFVLWVEPHANRNFEVFFVEVKKQGNFANGHLESDLVKLGKEMQLGLNKLLKRKVENPEVVGLLLEGGQATAYKMDLLYNGQYRMVELSRFFLTRDNVDDVMLVPTIMEKLCQLQCIIQNTIDKLYQAIQEPSSQVDITPYMRSMCGSPVAVKCEKK